MGLSVYLQEEVYKDFKEDFEEVYWANITHNLNVMAEKAGIYEALWRPHRLKSDYKISNGNYEEELVFEMLSVTRAKELIPILEKGLAKLKQKPKYFSNFNAKNGWGLYEHFVPFVEKYLQACKENPNSIVKVSR